MSRGIFRGGGVFWGSKPPLFEKIFFNLLGFFKEKIVKTPPKFSRPYKKFLKPSLKKFLDTPLSMSYFETYLWRGNT